ncbi:MAG: hypothetical protein NTZ32_01105 [Planctomycetales bacterium]|nr:hypothetical protein [Planctomycetales bacterium]
MIAADDTDFWPVTIQVGRLLPRKPCPFPLAIDFGNSFSYAAVLNEGIIRDLSDPIIGVHDRFALEEFPTILAVRRFVPDHPLQSEFVVGTFAQAVSSDNDGLGWPVTDLKSWLGQDDGDQERPVIDAGQMTYYVRVSVLVQMFLYGVIQRAEAIFRQYFVAKIVTSYPAKLTPHARRRWLSLVDDVCMQISKEREPRNQPIEHCHAQVDEANAVATGFVLDNEQRQYELADHEHGQDGFVVAAFDLGGGSLDTALLRFRIDNPDGGIGIYASKYLGIGGQPDFGGDNVTIAVMELLCDRIASRLPTSRLSETLLANLPSPQNHFQTAGPSRGLYEALWTAADWFKRSLCEQAVGAAAGPLQLSVNSPDPHVRAFIELLHATLKDPQFRPSLDEVYRHPIRADQHGKGSYTVEQRLAVSIDELATFAKNKSVTVDYVVLGGNSSRIPLAQDLLKLSFPDAQIVFNPKRLKCRVAEGLVRTIYYLDGVGPSLALSGQCTTRSIGVLVNGTGEPVVIIPACTPVDPSQRFPLVAKNGKSIALRRVALSGRLAVYTDVEHRRFRREIGSFDLGKLSVPITDATTMVALRFVGSDEESLQLLIEMEGQMQALDLGHSRS